MASRKTATKPTSSNGSSGVKVRGGGSRTRAETSEAPASTMLVTEGADDIDPHLAWSTTGALPGAPALPNDFNPDGPPHPEDPTLLRFIDFEGYVRAFRTEANTGELILTIAVRPDQKYAAFRLTDHMMFRYRFDVYKAPRRRRTRTPQPDHATEEESDA